MRLNDEHKGNASAETAGAAPERRRQRLPVKATLSLDDTPPANTSHPLVTSAPEVRGVSRVRLIAAILARLARSAYQ